MNDDKGIKKSRLDRIEKDKPIGKDNEIGKPKDKSIGKLHKVDKIVGKKPDKIGKSHKIDVDKKKEKTQGGPLPLRTLRSTSICQQIPLNPDFPDPIYPKLVDRDLKVPNKLTRLPKQTIINAIVNSDGMISRAARLLQVAPWNLSKFLSKDKQLKQLLTSVAEADIDFAESRLKDKIRMGDNTAIIFYLKCKGRHRGWIDVQTDKRREQSPPVTFKYVLVKGDDTKAITAEIVDRE